jgi:hypothetical protein
MLDGSLEWRIGNLGLTWLGALGPISPNLGIESGDHDHRS